MFDTKISRKILEMNMQISDWNEALLMAYKLRKSEFICTERINLTQVRRMRQ